MMTCLLGPPTRGPSPRVEGTPRRGPKEVQSNELRTNPHLHPSTRARELVTISHSAIARWLWLSRRPATPGIELSRTQLCRRLRQRKPRRATQVLPNEPRLG